MFTGVWLDLRKIEQFHLLRQFRCLTLVDLLCFRSDWLENPAVRLRYRVKARV